ncbi:exopolyphosphatase [Nordella sp. HKS 07]|uniref:exopolyphosphatase n=1 Tax=Nordella sp. HKS 07 TaxID=2712222 RepID=UPI0013E1ACDB|nr:exopolyphosphatase [Nordella sp. HKS 07]QIG50725.1 exopolyphosphatase [Nordella sp. HKS 07]
MKRKRIGSGSTKYRPVSVVDIGSNSVRLVVYDGLRRAPTPVFNEKILCGLGRGVATTRQLNPQGMERALAALRRFKALSRQIGAREVYSVATAAAREAENGPQFVDMAEEALGAHIDVLSGKEEARLAAMGVMAGVSEADGLIGDLGGGSLELIDVNGGQIRDGITFPLGPLRLIDMSGGSTAKAREIIDKYLDSSPLLTQLKGRSLYAVGGTWRSIARIHMAQTRYPLHVLHNYTIGREQARSVADLVAHLSSSSLKDIKTVSKSRIDTLPYGALVLERLLAKSKVKQMVVSIYGVREGLLYSKLPKRKREADALLSSCWDFCCRYARSPEHELELCDWTDKLFAHKSFEETEAERRLRQAACFLADIGWRAHPDYRAQRSLGMISQAAFVDIDHAGRVFLALTIYYRYEGEEEGLTNNLARLVDDRTLERARLLSEVFRLAYIITAAMPGVLPKIALEMAGTKNLTLRVPKKLADLMGERVAKRLDALAGQLGRLATIEIV